MRSRKLRCILMAGLSILMVSQGTSFPGETITSRIWTTTVKNGWAVNYPKQRKLFFMAGLIWVFYSDGRDAVYKTSPDGFAWSDATVLREGASLGHRFGCWYDGTFFHCVHCAASEGEDVVYRRGKPNRDGSISWSSSEQTACSVPTGKNVMYPKVIVDSAGAPWVAFMVYDGGFNEGPYDAIVTKSSASDGTWQAELGFPFLLVDNNTTSYPDPVGVPLTQGKTFWVYNKNVMDDTYYGRHWNGKSWDPEEAVTQSHSSYGLYNVVSDGNNVHMVFGGGTIRYRKRDPRTGWGSEVEVAKGGSGHTSITRTGPDSVIVTWLDCSEDILSYRKKVKGQWAPAVVWIDEAKEGLAYPRLGINSNAFVESSASMALAVVYTTGHASPYSLKFAGLQRAARQASKTELVGESQKTLPEE